MASSASVATVSAEYQYWLSSSFCNNTLSKRCEHVKRHTINQEHSHNMHEQADMNTNLWKFLPECTSTARLGGLTLRGLVIHCVVECSDCLKVRLAVAPQRTQWAESVR